MHTCLHFHEHVTESKSVIHWMTIVMISLAIQQSKGIKSFCDSIEVKQGSSSTLTCHFDEDVSKHQRNIYVDYLHTNETDSPETVMACRWKNASVECDSLLGYQLVNNLPKNSISVLIPETLPNHAGQYWCEVVGYDAFQNTRCHLVVLPSDTHTDSERSIASVFTNATKNNIGIESYCKINRTGSSAALTCCFNLDISSLQRSVFVDHASEHGSEAVLSCRWKDGIYHCESGSGYIMNSNVSNKFTVEIPSVDDVHAGVYWCEVLQSEPAKQERCVLSVPGRDESKNNINGLIIQKKSGTETSTNHSTDSSTIIRISMGVLSAAIIIIILISAYFIRRNVKANSADAGQDPTAIIPLKVVNA